MSEIRLMKSISASTFRNLLPKSRSSKHKTNTMLQKSTPNCENTPPIDPNVQLSTVPVSASSPKPKQSAAKIETFSTEVTRSDESYRESESIDPEVIRSDESYRESASVDPSVKVVVRIRPSDGFDKTVKKLSSDSLCAGQRKFAFDSVLDSNSNQEDVFQLVGVPLVKNALAGYNISVLACGQTGSGKTYTMWGPPSAMVDGQSADGHQGIVPRILRMLFSEIQKDQENLEGVKQIHYQLRCSFLEVYNEQIGDLLDPTQRNLEIKDDAKSGFYVENLTEEYVTNYDEVTQLLIKGLSSRKVGATSINSKSSRSHILFTCTIESWCKGTSSNRFGSSKTSRISLVDLAGLDRNRIDNAGRQCKKEDKYIKKSIAQLGNLVNMLVESGKSEAVPYRSSCLTHLLRDSLGGNSKLTVICTVSPDNRYYGETVSTLRFAQRAKSIKNEPVINEITEDDVNDLTDKIRQLKEELIRARSSACPSNGSKQGRSVRESVNQLRVGLNRSLILPCLDNDPEEEVHIDENDVKKLCLQLDNLCGSCEDNSKYTFEGRDRLRSTSFEGCETDLSENYISCPEDDNEEIESGEFQTEQLHQNDVVSTDDLDNCLKSPFNSSISIATGCQSAVLQDPSMSESPKIGNAPRKSMIFTSSHLADHQDNMLRSSKFNSDVPWQLQIQNDHVRSSLQSSKIFSGPTESLAASLQRGLEIIDHHQRSSASIRSSVAFSFQHLSFKPCPTIDKVNASVQTLTEKRLSSDGPSGFFICASCEKRGISASNEAQDDSIQRWMVVVDESGNSNEAGNQDAEKDLMEAKERQMELENICKEQAAKIEKLNYLMEQYKHEKDENAVTEYIKAAYEQHANEENNLPKNQNKLLRWNDRESYEPEISKEKCEIKEVQEEFGGNTSFDMNEKEALLKEIEVLRSKLQSFAAVPPTMSAGKLRSSCLLSQSLQLRKSAAFAQCNNEDELDKERQRWTEIESDWISLTDELRLDLESNRQRAEKVEMELRLEKKCTEELDDALKRAVIGHARMVEHYAELQEKYNDVVTKHRLIMEGIAEVKRAAAKAGAKGHGSRFARSLAAELSALRVERERERELLKKENRSLRVQLRDTAEAVHAAGELLVRLREAEEAASVAEGHLTKVQEENEKLKKQMEKLKRKHKMEMITMKQYLAESRLPEAALRPLYREDSDITSNDTTALPDDDQAWRAEFGAIYQEHY